MRRIVVAALLAACGPGGRSDIDDPDEPELPAGVFEFPRAGRPIAAMTADADSLWFLLYPPLGVTTGLAVAQTTLTGEPLLETDNIDSPGIAYADGAGIAVTGLGVLAAWHKDDGGAYVRMFDRSGAPLHAAEQRLPITENGLDVYVDNDFALTRTPNGGARLLVSVVGVAEVALVELSATGEPTGPALLAGMNDDGEIGAVGAAALDDGSSLIAWDRVYDQCFGAHPAETVTAAVDGTMPTMQPVRDLPERSEMSPVVAARDGGAYVAWQTGWEGNTLALARYPDLSTAVDLADQGMQPRLALASGDRGALLWNTGGAAIYIAAFAGLTVDTTRAIPRVTLDVPMYAIGLAHVADNRYVVLWQEGQWGSTTTVHVYGTIIDFDEPAPRPVAPAPTTIAPSRPRWASAVPPCSH